MWFYAGPAMGRNCELADSGSGNPAVRPHHGQQPAVLLTSDRASSNDGKGRGIPFPCRVQPGR